MRKVIQTSQKQTSDSEEERLMSLQEVFLVNPFPSQAKEREQTITVTSGLICSEPYMKSNPIGLLVKMLLASSQWYSPVRRRRWEVNPLYSQRVTLYIKDNRNMSLKPFAVILNVKDIPSSRYLYRLVPSELPTAGTGYGLLPTVTAQDYKLRGPNSSQQGLPEIIRAMLLPTPLATEIHHPERVHKWKQAHAPSLHSQLKGEKKPNGLSDFLDFYGMLLPTPVASDAGVGAVMGKNDKIIVTPKGKVRKINQKGHVWSVGLGRMAELLPTPTARDWKGAASPESLEKRGRIPEKNSLPDFFARTGKSFQLNPLFVAEMMGFPPDWTVSPFLGEDRHPLKDTGTLSSPR